MSPVAHRVRELLQAFPDRKAIVEFIDRSDRTRIEVLEMYYERVEEIRNENLHAALILAELGVDLSHDVMRFASPRERALIKAKALAVCGGVHRTLAGESKNRRESHWRIADAAYTVAYRFLKPFVSRPPIELVEIYGRWAFLKRDQRLFEDAKTFARRSLEIAVEAGDNLWIPRAEVFLANICVTEGEIEAGIELYRDALQKLTLESDPLFYRAAIQSYAVALCHACEPREHLNDEIISAIDKFKPLALELPARSIVRAHLHWLEGLFHFLNGEFSRARAHLSRAKSVFLECEMVYYAAGVSMDLALTLLASGDSHGTRRLATEVGSIFEMMHVDREQLRALRIFVKAAEDNVLTESLVKSLKMHLIGFNYR